MLRGDGGAGRLSAIGPSPVRARERKRHRSAAIHVVLAVDEWRHGEDPRQRRNLPGARLPRRNVGRDDRVPGRVVPGGHGERHLVARDRREAEPVVRILDAVVRRAHRPRGRDGVRQRRTGRNRHDELRGPNPCEGLTVLARCLSPHTVTAPGTRQKVTFVARVDEHRRSEQHSAGRGDRRDLLSLLGNTAAGQSLIEVDRDAG